MTLSWASRFGRANPFPAGPRGGAACTYCSTGLRGISAQYLPLFHDQGPSPDLQAEATRSGPAQTSNRSWGDPREGSGVHPESSLPTAADHRRPPLTTADHRGHEPHMAGSAPRFQRRRGEGDGVTAPPAACTSPALLRTPARPTQP
ncbi:hypothetical protein CRENBAI_025192 [Crenichthys baileyi]|uniref:Uncharacterized protein n=1 Tax=Crenichthys baileyi TaxID=28760 RepID=A0AAV9RHL0_9TELE